MIAACPKCGVRYRIERERLRPEGVRLRCSRCEAIFRVSPPEPRSPEVEAAPPARRPAPRATAERSSESISASGPEARAQRGAAERSSESWSASGPEARAQRGPASLRLAGAERSHREGPLVLVADPDVETGKTTVGTLADWGFRTLLAHDGVEAILAIQRSLPEAVILDAALPKMFGFQVCELVKRNESLRGIRVVLVGAIHDPERYRRPPSELYGADAYVERQDLARQLRRVLGELGFSAGADADPAEPAAASPPRAAVPAPPEREAAARPRGREPAAPRQPASRPATDARNVQLAQAERLARIIVSDIVLYNPEKLDAAIRAGRVLEEMDAELEEGRTLFRQRIDASVRDERDFLAEEMLRVARLRDSR